MTNESKIVIVMATYYRKNKKTSIFLKRSLNSILNQTFKNWDLIIVGDKYEPEDELIQIINTFKIESQVDKNEINNIIYLKNENVERDFVVNKRNLWHCAGATSMNMGLDYARNNNYKYYCHLDDDDYWEKNHLELIYNVYQKYTDCIFVNTKSTYGSGYLPNENVAIFRNNRLPIPSGTIHSSFSFRLDIINFNYHTSLTKEGIPAPADSKMLSNIANFLQQNKNFCSIYISKLTCHHDTEFE